MPPVIAKRYALLDGLRGVAAIGVMLYHFPLYVHGNSLFAHGFLAVDFFFILSGFVVSHAYSGRILEIGCINFLELRLRRLLPMSICGVLLGTALLIARWRLQPQISDDLPHLLAASGLNLFLIPKFWMGRASGPAMFPANLVLWSLMLEFAINLIWAAWFVQRRSVTLAIPMCAGWIVFVLSAWQNQSSSVGWTWNTLLGGVGRITFGFFAGVLIARVRSQVRLSPVMGWISSIGLVLVLCLPVCSWWIDVLLVLIILPSIVYLASASASHHESAVCRVLGDISYPLYLIHWPLGMAVSRYLGWHHPPDPLRSVGLFLCLPIIAVAYLLNRFYEVPVRLWLRRRQLDAVFKLREASVSVFKVTT